MAVIRKLQSLDDTQIKNAWRCSIQNIKEMISWRFSHLVQKEVQETSPNMYRLPK